MSTKQTASQADGVEYRRAKTWQIAMTMMSNSLSMTFYTLIGYMSYLANAGYGIALAAAGVILTVTRLFDGIIDPFLALLMDRVNTRFGKLRIFMVAGWVLRTLAVLLLFVWLSNKGQGAVLFVILYCLYIIGASTCDIAGNMAAAVITNDPQQRPMVGVWGTVYAYLVPTVLSALLVMLVLPRFGNEYTAEMLSTTALIIVPVSLVFLVLTCLGISEADKPENFRNVSASGDDGKVSLADMWHLIKANRPFQMYVLHCVSSKLSQQTMSQAIVTTVVFGILIGNIQYGTMISIVAMLPSIVFAIVAGKFCGKVGSKKIAVFAMLAGIVATVIMVVFCAAIDMTSISSLSIQMIVFFVLILVINGLKMCITTADNAMRSDVIDYELSRSGKYLPAVVNATYNVIDQVISSLGSTIAAVSISFVGYATTTPQPTDPSTPALKAMGLFLYFGLPVLGWLIGLFAMKHYDLGRERMVEVQRDIADKKAALSESEEA